MCTFFCQKHPEVVIHNEKKTKVNRLVAEQSFLCHVKRCNMFIQIKKFDLPVKHCIKLSSNNMKKNRRENICQEFEKLKH